MDESLEQALAALPHGVGFRFVDRLTALEPGKSASGVYLLKGSESFLAAHFPGEPIMPAVLMIEAIAQVAGIAARGGASPAPSQLRLAAVRQAKILAAARPGDQLCIQAILTATLGDLIQAEGQISTLEKGGGGPSLVATAQVTLAVDR
jgi:3-hydroxyacyl-[acyl-carrier-protein] dehydratase